MTGRDPGALLLLPPLEKRGLRKSGGRGGTPVLIRAQLPLPPLTALQLAGHLEVCVPSVLGEQARVCGPAREQDEMGQFLVTIAADSEQAELGVPGRTMSPGSPTHDHWQGWQDRPGAWHTARRGQLTLVGAHSWEGALQVKDWGMGSG